MNSSKITSELTAYDIIKHNLKKLKTEIKKVNRRKIKKRHRKIKTEVNHKEKRLVDTPTLSGVSYWLTILSITEFGFELSKQSFWDSIRLRYCWENMQSTNILSLR